MMHVNTPSDLVGKSAGKSPYVCMWCFPYGGAAIHRVVGLVAPRFQSVCLHVVFPTTREPAMECRDCTKRLFRFLFSSHQECTCFRYILLCMQKVILQNGSEVGSPPPPPPPPPCSVSQPPRCVLLFLPRACKGLCDRSWCHYILLSAKKISNFFLSLKILTFRRPLQHRNFLLRI